MRGPWCPDRVHIMGLRIKKRGQHARAWLPWEGNLVAHPFTGVTVMFRISASVAKVVMESGR